MKANFRILYSFAAAAMTLTALTACQDDIVTERAKEEGKLRTSALLPEVQNGEMVIADDQRAHKAPSSRAAIDLSDYIVTVENSLGENVATWTYRTMPDLPTFPVGSYTLTVRSCEVQPAAWEQPYFLGTEKFDIKNGEITEVQTVKCVLSNIRVSVNFDDELKALCGPDVEVTVTSLDTHALKFTPSETRSGYFQAVENLSTFMVRFSGTVKGNAEDFTYTLKDIAPGQHRKINFSLRANPATPPDEYGTIDNNGGISVSTTVTGVDLTSDTPVEETILGSDDRPGQEEKPTDPDTPNPPASDSEITFASSTLKLDAVNNPTAFGEEAGVPAVVTIASKAGFKNLKVEIISNELNKEMLQGVGLDSEFDLATGRTPDGKDLSEALSDKDSFGFPVGSQVTGAGVTSVNFDITQFVPLLAMYDGLHQFRITVVDTTGASKSMILKFQK